MQPIGFTPFLLDDTTKKECGVFELTFFVNNMKHLYYLEVDNSAVLKETLKYFLVSNQPKFSPERPLMESLISD